MTLKREIAIIVALLFVNVVVSLWLIVNGEGPSIERAGWIYLALDLTSIVLFLNLDKLKWK